MTPEEWRTFIAENDGDLPAYAWPGGYPIFYVCADNEVLCPDCANKEGRFDNSGGREWHIVAMDVNYEDMHCRCANCEKPIPPGLMSEEEWQNERDLNNLDEYPGEL